MEREFEWDEAKRQHMSEERITRRTRNQLGEGRMDWARVEETTEEEIEAQARADDSFWTDDELGSAEFVMPEDQA